MWLFCWRSSSFSFKSYEPRTRQNPRRFGEQSKQPFYWFLCWVFQIFPFFTSQTGLVLYICWFQPFFNILRYSSPTHTVHTALCFREFLSPYSTAFVTVKFKMQSGEDWQNCLLRQSGLFPQTSIIHVFRNRLSHRVRFETERTYVPNTDITTVNQRHGVQMEELNHQATTNDIPLTSNNAYTNPIDNSPQTEHNNGQELWSLPPSFAEGFQSPSIYLISLFLSLMR